MVNEDILAILEEYDIREQMVNAYAEVVDEEMVRDYEYRFDTGRISPGMYVWNNEDFTVAMAEAATNIGEQNVYVLERQSLQRLADAYDDEELSRRMDFSPDMVQKTLTASRSNSVLIYLDDE